jgi:hypothetical protein
MNKYKNIKITPVMIVIIGYVYLLIVSIFLYSIGFGKNNKFFRWGIPVTILGQEINDEKTFYSIWIIVLFNTSISTAFTEIVYSWMLNCVQDPKSVDTIYSKPVSLLLISLNALYYSIHMLVLMNAIMTQFSFFLASFLGGIIVIMYTNWQYILRVNRNKTNLLNENNEENFIC